MSNPKISIIIPAYNSEKTISQTITAVLKQDFPGGIEVIVVDDGSIDGTADIIKSFGEQSGIKYISQENNGPAAARNRGVQEASGEFVFFTDADCIPHRDWVNKMMPHFVREASDKIAVVAGSYGIANPESLLARCIHKEILYRHHHLMPDFPRVFGSYNFCVRKKIFNKVGGFNAGYRHASGEDNDLSYKILSAGYKIYFEKEAVVDHHHPARVAKYLREQYRHGFWRVKMYLAHPSRAKGDDYTFWKDIVEIPLAVLLSGALLLSMFGFASAPACALGLFTGLLLMELYFGKIITGALPQGFFWGLVMFLRVFARAAGFIRGVLNAPAIFFSSKIP